MINWNKIAEDLKVVLGYHALRVNEDGAKAFVLSDNTPIAILLGNSSDQNAIDLHLRASILPNTAALLSAVISHSHAINISENFEFDGDGEWLHGKDALRFAAENAKVLWEHADKSSGTATASLKLLN